MYWLVYKFFNGNRMYIYEIDRYGNPMYTDDCTKAIKFYNFSEAMNFFGSGCVVEKHYNGKVIT